MRVKWFRKTQRESRVIKVSERTPNARACQRNNSLSSPQTSPPEILIHIISIYLKFQFLNLLYKMSSAWWKIYTFFERPPYESKERRCVECKLVLGGLTAGAAIGNLLLFRSKNSFKRSASRLASFGLLCVSATTFVVARDNWNYNLRLDKSKTSQSDV